jgi:beta-glucanase (GH16 family)
MRILESLHVILDIWLGSAGGMQGPALAAEASRFHEVKYENERTGRPTPPKRTRKRPKPAPKPALVPHPFGQNPAHYALTFSEDFRHGINTKVWNDHIWYERSNATRNYAVEEGALKIWPQRDASGNFFNRTLDTDGKYYQTYGYFEVEAKLPVGKGLWPAFWLLNHDDLVARPGIDIMEAYPGGGPSSGWSDANLRPTLYAGRVHWPDAGPYTPSTRTDLSAAFHKYGCKWDASSVSFYFDGKLIGSAQVSMPGRMYLLLDLWHGSASGATDDSTPTGKSNAYEINYVRAWKFKQ